MNWVDLLAVFAAGAAAGLINTVVGSGTLITFPVLIALGLPPVVANVSNTVGLAPGSLSGALAMREELGGQRRRILRLGSGSLLGGICGAILLLLLPASAYSTIVPALIAVGVILVIVQPAWSRRLRERQLDGAAVPRSRSVGLWLGVLGLGVYGGYFGAAQGVLLIGLLGIALDETLPRVNALKNVLAMIVNGVAAVMFALLPFTPWSRGAGIYWPAALTIAVGSVLGAQLGGRVGRRLPPMVYRVIIVIVGVVAIVNLLRTR